MCVEEDSQRDPSIVLLYNEIANAHFPLYAGGNNGETTTV